MSLLLAGWLSLAVAEDPPAVEPVPERAAESPDLGGTKKERPPETGKGAWVGAGEGFLIGSAGGLVLSTFSPWILNGQMINIYAHAGVDMLIVAVPATIVGAVIGARKPKALLRPSLVHLAVSWGYTDLLAQQGMKEAYEASGYAWEAPFWFGRAHWPRGYIVASPYAWSASADVSIVPRVQVGLSWNDTLPQRIWGADVDAQSQADAWTIAALGTWVVDPIGRGNDRLEWAVGLGAGLSRLVEKGVVAGEDYRVTRYEPTVPFRATIDWYATKRTSLQLKVGTRMHFPLEIPTVENDGVELAAHHLEFSSFDVTLGVRTHWVGATP